MFALLALICFVIAQFEPALGSVDLALLGLALISLHLFWPLVWTGGRLAHPA